MAIDTNKLGEGFSAADAVLRPITMQDIIDAVNANCDLGDDRRKNEMAVRETARKMLADLRKDMDFLLEYNMTEIIRRARA